MKFYTCIEMITTKLCPGYDTVTLLVKSLGYKAHSN